eukprot:6448136-Lingulodinium_polyedra.AAC.1
MNQPTAYLAAELKRGRGEVSERRLTDIELAEFDEAKARELGEWLQEAALERLNQGEEVPPDRCLKM